MGVEMFMGHEAIASEISTGERRVWSESGMEGEGS